jgi:hypothetical protein
MDQHQALGKQFRALYSFNFYSMWIYWPKIAKYAYLGSLEIEFCMPPNGPLGNNFVQKGVNMSFLFYTFRPIA